jgi:hypothetical protein
VGADVDGAQAQAAWSLDHLLPIAVADAGVDIEAAEAEAVARSIARGRFVFPECFVGDEATTFCQEFVMPGLAP